MRETALDIEILPWIGIPLLVIGQTGGIQYANQAFCALFDQTNDTLAGTPLTAPFRATEDVSRQHTERITQNHA